MRSPQVRISSISENKIMKSPHAPHKKEMKKVLLEEFLACNMERSTEKLQCNCMRSQCTKLYCECYKAKQPCGDFCRCVKCRNKAYDKGFIKGICSTFCTCTRSRCDKGYCLCFSKKKKCGKKCLCVDCHNAENYAGSQVADGANTGETTKVGRNKVAEKKSKKAGPKMRTERVKTLPENIRKVVKVKLMEMNSFKVSFCDDVLF